MLTKGLALFGVVGVAVLGTLWAAVQASQEKPQGVEAMLQSGSLVSTEPLLEVRTLLRQPS